MIPEPEPEYKVSEELEPESVEEPPPSIVAVIVELDVMAGMRRWLP